LNHWINANQKTVDKGKIQRLQDDQFSDYHTTTVTLSLSINQFDGKKKEGGYCKMAGHQMRDQVCRTGTQMWHVDVLFQSHHHHHHCHRHGHSLKWKLVSFVVEVILIQIFTNIIINNKI
jgi:hypothetical protein